MSKAKSQNPLKPKREIIVRLNWLEATDLMQQLSIHKRELKAEVKRLQQTQEERGENGLTDQELWVTEEWLAFTRSMDRRLLRIYRRYQKRHDRELEKQAS